MTTIESLLASLESVQRDAEVMAESVIRAHNEPSTGMFFDALEPECDCPACTVARNYAK